jgi:hypothetical protein
LVGVPVSRVILDRSPGRETAEDQVSPRCRIYLSAWRVIVGGQLYPTCLIGIGEPGSDVLISQDIKGTSDNGPILIHCKGGRTRIVYAICGVERAKNPAGR